jgi:uncharacterized pyridoxal phosphate-containing UPF0001 family protein
VSGSGKAYRRQSHAKENAKSNARRAAKLQATPKWVDFEKVEEFYILAQRISAETGVIHHVDHIVPLMGKTVCGLHWEGNLQILPGRDNLSKGNKFNS